MSDDLSRRIAAANRVQADMEHLTGQPQPRFDEHGIAQEVQTMTTDDYDDPMLDSLANHEAMAGSDLRPVADARQDADDAAHLTYFDTRTQASFRWDGASDVVEVGIGGYGEPVDHTIPAPWAPHNPRRADVLWFADLCRMHAATLPVYGRIAGDPVEVPAEYDGGPFTGGVLDSDEGDR